MPATSLIPRGLLLAALLGGAALPGFAQGVGEIRGNVLDSTGAILPGATVTLTNTQGAVGGNQETVSDSRGTFGFVRLVPGTYSVRAQLTGFQTVTQGNIVVNADATARADLRLGLGAIEEAITVTSQAPLLDTSNAIKQTTITKAELDALPNRTDIWSVTKVLPSVVMNKIDVGGSEAFNASVPIVRGATGDSKFMVDGASPSTKMAFRMQSSVPELTDLSKEPEHTYELYGPDSRKPGTFAANCLMARRLAERGVRFIQLYHRAWDHHGALPRSIRAACRETDQSCAGLVQDLKERGLLEDTLVVWGGEFGRTVYCQGKLTPGDYGRDHHPRCFTMWMAGAGVKPGISIGTTDDYSYNVVDDPVHIHDLNATILHSLGIDHTRLTYKYQGRHFRLTDVHGTVVRQALL